METTTQIRKYGIVRNIPDDVDETRTITFVASDDSVDRHGTVINMDNWDLEGFKGNPIVGWQHNVYGDTMCGDPDPDQILGRAGVRLENREMLADITFEDKENNPLAEKIFNKVKSGILNAVSIGFLETGEGRMGNFEDGENPEVYYFEGQELIEISVVSIPSNKNALRKSLRSQTASALQYIYKELGGKIKFSEIEEMRVRDIMDLIEGKEPEEKTHPIGEFNARFVKMKHKALTVGDK
jgi:HK97 family phage prohead protease